jgi:hypothetical protein
VSDGSFQLIPASGFLAQCGFFAPVAEGAVEGLMREYEAERLQVSQMAAIGNSKLGPIFRYFIKGNLNAEQRGGVPSTEAIFLESGAVSALDAAYWDKALKLTDVLDYMPEKRRTEWRESIEKRKTPEFVAEAVYATLREMLMCREKFFAERIDGIFRGLSGEHVTNAPEAFGKRMIIGWMLSYGSLRYEKTGLIHDLRCVIAKFMGRDQPSYADNQPLLHELQKCTGKWHEVDGGALRVRLYKKGTAHLEVHPEIAWRLNGVLAYLYPTAIPASFRQKPKREKKFELLNKPLPFSVLTLLGADQRHVPAKVFRFAYEAKGKGNSLEQAGEVLRLLGGLPSSSTEYCFDYDYRAALDEILLTGCVPDSKAHQFYPTPEIVAKMAADLAEIGPGHSVLEPSAGNGDLAWYLPHQQTTCVEVAGMRIKALQARGLQALEADFLEWAKTAPQFDRVVMNPPFSEGRAKLHLEAAQGLVRSGGGRLVAILPESHRKLKAPAGWSYEWSERLDNEFAGTSVSVVILTAVRA